ncbi:MAG TPA: XRE family transcriptional regulator [Acetobacteraceae bacterium]|nr:XRE family transcriptional regulator [Acetobacteraceae bacterium]
MRDTPVRDTPPEEIERRLAERLGALRAERGLSLDELATRTGISRATLSRLERAETSPTAAMLGRLCAAYGWTLSRLMAAAEGEAPALMRRADQPAWSDPETGFRRRAVSPPGPGLRMEMLEGELPAGAAVAYDAAPVPGMEQHVLVLSGTLDFALGARSWRLLPGDCLRVRIEGPTRLAAGPRGPARYLIAICPP